MDRSATRAHCLRLLGTQGPMSTQELYHRLRALGASFAERPNARKHLYALLRQTPMIEKLPPARGQHSIRWRLRRETVPVLAKPTRAPLREQFLARAAQLTPPARLEAREPFEPLGPGDWPPPTIAELARFAPLPEDD